ncbi:prepilin peptidase [Lujinxingia vulgaris]|uniref:Prepilin peptidase n=1 Tax=Lujinxingia vulgaris TaxID=2600176 RepID=A0A5C6X6S3_9DELT|nr:A24 family peptidase [Lujinxingia vulgaris]TXD33660.1 prepilin peptidase [Lujinxingia vulgaris]
MQPFTELPLWSQLLVMVPLVVICLIAAITDFRERKVYNTFTYPGVIIGLVAHTLAFGWAGLGSGLLAAFTVLVVGIIILPFRWLGGGDIKLLAMIGAFVGFSGLYVVFFYATLVGLAMGITLSVANGYITELIKRLWLVMKAMFFSITSRTNLGVKMETDERAYLPFAIPIFFGVLLALTDAYAGWPLWLDGLRLWMSDSLL